MKMHLKQLSILLFIPFFAACETFSPTVASDKLKGINSELSTALASGGWPAYLSTIETKQSDILEVADQCLAESGSFAPASNLRCLSTSASAYSIIADLPASKRGTVPIMQRMEQIAANSAELCQGPAGASADCDIIKNLAANIDARTIAAEISALSLNEEAPESATIIGLLNGYQAAIPTGTIPDDGKMKPIAKAQACRIFQSGLSLRDTISSDQFDAFEDARRAVSASSARQLRLPLCETVDATCPATTKCEEDPAGIACKRAKQLALSQTCGAGVS